MRRASEVIPAEAMAGHQSTDRVVLDYDGRHRRRIAIETEAGETILLDLHEARHLRHGDGLALDDGRVILVEAAPEALLEIAADSPALLLRLAWHLGNRHLPAQLAGDSIRIREDHVIAEMVRGLGGTVTAIQAPFDPEGGAYGQAAVHSHGHSGHHGHHHHHG